MANKYGALAFSLVAFLLGISVGYLLYAYASNYLMLNVDKTITFQIDPFEVVSLTVTVLLGVYVLRQLGKRDELEKIEKELLAKHFEAFREDFETVVKGFVVTERLTLNDVTSRLKRFRMRMKMLCNLAIEQGFLQKNSDSIRKLNEAFSEIWILFTDTPRRGETGADQIAIRNGELSIPQQRVDQIADKIFQIQKTIFELIIEITRAE